MKKTLIIISAVIIGLIAAAAAMTGLYLKSTDYTAEKFPSGTSINGIDCSGLTYDRPAASFPRVEQENADRRGRSQRRAGEVHQLQLYL